jgi:hypothetical protein
MAILPSTLFQPLFLLALHVCLARRHSRQGHTHRFSPASRARSIIARHVLCLHRIAGSPEGGAVRPAVCQGANCIEVGGPRFSRPPATEWRESVSLGRSV